MTEHDRQIAEAMRHACIAAARDAYEDAGLSGLCAEGRWEAALGAIASVSLHEVVGKLAWPAGADSIGPPAGDTPTETPIDS